MKTFELFSNLELRSLIRNIRSFKEDVSSVNLFDETENKVKMLEWSKKDLENAKDDIERIMNTVNRYIDTLNLLEQKGGIEK